MALLSSCKSRGQLLPPCPWPFPASGRAHFDPARLPKCASSWYSLLPFQRHRFRLLCRSSPAAPLRTLPLHVSGSASALEVLFRLVLYSSALLPVPILAAPLEVPFRLLLRAIPVHTLVTAGLSHLRSIIHTA